MVYTVFDLEKGSHMHRVWKEDLLTPASSVHRLQDLTRTSLIDGNASSSTLLLITNKKMITTHH
jgi:hypothetical protein